MEPFKTIDSRKWVFFGVNKNFTVPKRLSNYLNKSAYPV